MSSFSSTRIAATSTTSGTCQFYGVVAVESIATDEMRGTGPHILLKSMLPFPESSPKVADTACHDVPFQVSHYLPAAPYASESAPGSATLSDLSREFEKKEISPGCIAICAGSLIVRPVGHAGGSPSEPVVEVRADTLIP
jgi:hypothetical protein